MRETVTQHLYGVSKKDHINYSYISSIDVIDATTKCEKNQEINQLSIENRRIVLPSFNDMINYVFEMQKKRSQKHTYGRCTVRFSYEIYTEILYYLRLCLRFSAGMVTDPSELRETGKLNDFIRKNYSSNGDNAIQKYLLFIKDILPAKRGSIELTCLNDLLNAELEELTKQCFDLLEIFIATLKDVTELTRVLVSQIVGILWAIGCDDNEFNSHVSEKFI